MSTPALALAPVLVDDRTGARASPGPAPRPDHRYHTLYENTDGEQEGPEGGLFMARDGPGAPPFPLLPGPGLRVHPVRGRA